VPHPKSLRGGAHFAHHEARRLTAEQLIDALAQVTEAKPGRFGSFGRPTLAPITSMPENLKAVSISDGSAVCTLASSLGRPERSTGFESERGTDLDRDCVEFLATLSRLPRESEKQKTVEYLVAKKSSRAEAVKDLMWALLNADGFLLNQ
jgi:hypothetical protein